jgi:hypothetical protein
VRRAEVSVDIGRKKGEAVARALNGMLVSVSHVGGVP